MQLGLLMLRANNPHEVMFVYWKMELLIGIEKNIKILLLLFSKYNTII
jgi:hypothetical protein